MNKKKLKKRIFKLLAVMAFILIALYMAMYYIFGNLLTEDESIPGWKNSMLVDQFGNKIVLDDRNTKKKPGAYNILLGSTDKGGTRTDSIMLVHYDTVEDEIACMSIPRDTYIATDRGSKRINSAYAYGKSDEFVAKTEETFGIDIDYYVMLDVDTFKNVVDAMGGVEIDVQFDMDYEDPAQNLSIHIKKGKQTLMGADAEGFVRYRKGYAAADIARIDAQQIFVASAISKLKENPLLIPKVITTAFDGIKTNIKQNNAIKIATSVLDMDFSQIRMFTLPGRSASRKGVSYYSLYKDETLRLINEYFNTYKKNIKTSQCAMIELVEPPEGYEYKDVKTLEEVAQTMPPKKTSGFKPKKENPEELPQPESPQEVQQEETIQEEITQEKEIIQEEISPEITDNETVDIPEIPQDIVEPEVITDMEEQSGQAGV